MIAQCYLYQMPAESWLADTYRLVQMCVYIKFQLSQTYSFLESVIMLELARESEKEKKKKSILSLGH